MPRAPVLGSPFKMVRFAVLLIEFRQNLRQIAILNTEMLRHAPGGFLGKDQFSEQAALQSFVKPEMADLNKAIFALLADVSHFRVLHQNAKGADMAAADE